MIAEVRRLLDEKKYKELRELLCSEAPADVAKLFEQFPEDELPLMFRLLHKDFATDVFVEMDTDLQQALIESFTDRELEYIVDDLFLDDTVDIIEEMPANVVNKICNVNGQLGNGTRMKAPTAINATKSAVIVN